MDLESSDGAKPVLIVGAGMAGLSCALALQAAGVPVRLFEASDGVGGRVRTDEMEGFLLDRGFQVYLDAYPETGALLDLEALDLRAFEPGALVYDGERLHRLMDVFRRPLRAWTSVTAPIGSLLDKLRVGCLRWRLLRRSLSAINSGEDVSTEAYLKARGFSALMIDRFFRSFYGGIFLERALRTSSRMFEFTFKMFSRGSATLPAEGMGEIPKQLAARLPTESLMLNAQVAALEATSITLASGQRIEGCAVVLATDASALKRLLDGYDKPLPRWRSVTNIYYSADSSPVNEPIICLNGSGAGLVNNVCVLSDAAPAYAPEGKSLISVSVLGLQNEPDLAAQVQMELVSWFGETVKAWRCLRVDKIKEALPEQLPVGEQSPGPGYTEFEGVWICGDHLASASIEGAVVSGKRVAEALLSRSS